MFSDYEMTIDLKKLDIPQNLAEDLFDVNWTDLGDIKQRLEKERQTLEKENEAIQEQIANAYENQVDEEIIESLKLQAQGNKARLEDIDKFYQKWNEAERKSTEERLKTYYKYLLNEQHERVKIRLETLRKLQEVEATSEFSDAQKETITNKLKEEENQALAKQTWKDFETSPMYMQLFDDIENMSKGALEQMIVTMGGLKTELQSMGLPASDLKEILSQINKVEEELERRNPFRNFAENANIALNRSKELAKLEEQRKSQQKDYNQVKMEYDSNQDLLATSQDYLSTLEVGSEEYDTQLSYVEILQRRVNELEKKLKDATDSVAETNNQINNINDSSNDFYEQLKNIGSITKSVVDGVFQITDAMSWLPEETQLSLERMKGLSDSAFTIAGGIGSIMSGDIIGGITSLISGVSGIVSLFMEWSSGAKEAAIQTERQGRLLTDLQNKYDRLNKAIDEAWDVAQIKQYNAELQKNLQQQIVAQKAIIEAQKSVKGANDYGSEQWLAVKEGEEELQNLYDTQEELQKNIYSKLTGGIMDDVLSTTESFVDAWYDAFKETGDGLKGLEDSFNEMLLNLVKRQATMKIAGRFIDEWDKALERYASEGGLSNSEIEYYANKVKNDLPALSSQLEAFFSSFDNVLGDASGNLSTLQRGVQGITESQADILASYANSCRFLLASIDTNLSHLASRVMSQMSGENPMVEQLRIIANNTQMLYNLFSGMTTSHSSGGRGLRVVI
jgi:DNA repair exonuclease SbcCD ATPase subunit